MSGMMHIQFFSCFSGFLARVLSPPPVPETGNVPGPLSASASASDPIISRVFLDLMSFLTVSEQF